MATGLPGRLNRDLRRQAQWSIVVTTLEILHLAWPETVADDRVTLKTDEDRITDVRRWKMVEAKRKRKVPSEIRFEREPQSDRPEDDTPLGLIDIKVAYTWNEETYLTMECKRIRSTDNDLALKYVRNGIKRFASGKYSAGHSFGIMVGYVICGNRSLCIDRVRKVLEKEPRTGTGFDPDFGWQTDHSAVNGQELQKSRHAQRQFGKSIELLHAFLQLE